MKGIELLGLKVKDRVTNTTGIVTSVSYDLYGCIQALISPSADTKNRDSQVGWYDIKRITILDDSPVMELPDWAREEIGCECKPIV